MAKNKEAPLVGILVYEGVEVLDFAGPFEVLCCATDHTGQSCFQVATVGPDEEVCCRGGLKVRPDYALDQAPQLDMLLVPGGPSARRPDPDRRLLSFIQEQEPKVGRLMSVCTGAYLLARSGILAGRAATTHSMWLADFAAKFPETTVLSDKIVDEGKIITAGGVASGVDLALYLLEADYGLDTRQREAKRLDGPWE